VMVPSPISILAVLVPTCECTNFDVLIKCREEVLVASSMDGKVYVWSITGKRLHVISASDTVPVTTVRWLTPSNDVPHNWLSLLVSSLKFIRVCNQVF
jgi:hypothetical protein